jgi:antitoxin VapB
LSLTITDPEAERLARELARRRGKPVEDVVVDAIRAALEGIETRPPGVASRLLAIGARCAARPVLQTASDEDVPGYDDMVR